MKTFGLLCIFAVIQQCAAATDWDAVMISTVALGAAAVFFVIIAAITVCCICCSCCRPLMCCEDCYPFNYYGSSGPREYTPERSESPVRRRTRRSTRYRRDPSPARKRSNSPRAWEGRNNPYKYSPGYRPRATANPKPVKQVPPEIVVVNDRGYAPPQNVASPMISSSSLQPGQVLGSYPAYQPGYPSNGVQQINAAQLQSQPWFPEVQRILNQQ